MLRKFFTPHVRHYEPSAIETRRRLLLPLSISVAIFLLNDFLLPLPGIAWLVIDWVLRAAIILLFLSFYATRRALRPLFSFPDPLPFLVWTMGCVAVSFVAFGVGRMGDGIFRFPPLSAAWVIADGAIGLPLVALSEELTFRATAFILFCHRHPVWWILGSSLVFGLAHWSFGLSHIIGTAVIGMALALSIQATRSLWSALIAHTLINLLFFTWPRL